jgi:hypothetical protein
MTGRNIELKLKEASAVLGVSPKDLQNLVQLKVLHPRRRANLCLFDGGLLIQAKVAFYLKQSLGASSEMLSLFTDALSREVSFAAGQHKVVALRSLPQSGRQPVEIRVPLGSLASEVESRLPSVPRGRRRLGWKAEMTTALDKACAEIGEANPEQVAKLIRAHRRRRSVLPEVTVVAKRTRKTA